MRGFLVCLLLVTVAWAAPVDDFAVPATGTPARGDIGDTTGGVGGQAVPVVDQQTPKQTVTTQQQQPGYVGQSGYGGGQPIYQGQQGYGTGVGVLPQTVGVPQQQGVVSAVPQQQGVVGSVPYQGGQYFPQHQQQQQFPVQGGQYFPQTQRQPLTQQGISQTVPVDTVGTGTNLPQTTSQVPPVVPVTILPVILPPSYGQFPGSGIGGYPLGGQQQFQVPYSGNWPYNWQQGQQQFPWWQQGQVPFTGFGTGGQQLGTGFATGGVTGDIGASPLGVDDIGLYGKVGPVGGTRLGYSRYPAGYWSMITGRQGVIGGSNLLPRTGASYAPGYSGYGTGYDIGFRGAGVGAGVGTGFGGAGYGTGFGGSGYGTGFGGTRFGAGYPYTGAGGYLGSQQSFPGYNRV